MSDNCFRNTERLRKDLTGIMAGEKHILLVDDDNDMLMLIERWLKKEYRVTAASSGQEAIDSIINDRPDLVLLDYVMPEMDGPATLRKIRSNEDIADVKVVFLTGMENMDNEELDGLNPAGFLAKSLGKKKLLPEIDKLLSD